MLRTMESPGSFRQVHDEHMQTAILQRHPVDFPGEPSAVHRPQLHILSPCSKSE